MESVAETFPDLTRGVFWKFPGTHQHLNVVAGLKQTGYTQLVWVRMRVFWRFVMKLAMKILFMLNNLIFINLLIISDTCQVRRSRSSNRQQMDRSSHHQIATHWCIDKTEFHHRIYHHVRNCCTGTDNQNKHNPVRPDHRCNRESRRTATIDRCTRDHWWRNQYHQNRIQNQRPHKHKH